MKEINMTKAISCMPDKFITMEMVELAATEHRPELVNYLPEKYITSEILDSIFKTDDYGWRSWQLSKIPEEKRNRQICLRAIKAEKSNFPDIPEKYRNSDILESLFDIYSLINSYRLKKCLLTISIFLPSIGDVYMVVIW